jgi:hypothetical protein
VIDVPGYRAPTQAMVRGASGSAGTWQFRQNPTGEIVNKPWYIAQVLTGPLNVVASVASVHAAERGVRPSTARTFDIGTLYTAVAGMLNLLVIMDSIYLGSRATAAGATESA